MYIYIYIYLYTYIYTYIYIFMYVCIPAHNLSINTHREKNTMIIPVNKTR